MIKLGSNFPQYITKLDFDISGGVKKKLCHVV